MGYKERRAKMIAKVAAPHLKRGERIQTGFGTVIGPGIFTKPGEWIIATNRGVLVVGPGTALRFPRDIRFGKPTGIYHRIQLDRPYKVHRQWYPEVIAADEALQKARDDPAEDGD